VHLTMVSASSALGGSVVLEGEEVVYTPPAQNPGDDQFQYTIEDSSGATSAASVYLRRQAPPQIGVIELQGGMIVLKLTGLPNSHYEVLKSNDAVTWAFASEGDSDVNGQATVDMSPGGESMQFYRLRFP